MLKLTIPAQDLYNESTNEFIYQGPVDLELEHSLFSISKWEAKFEKPFLGNTNKKDRSETLEYIKMMCITPGIDDSVFSRLSESDFKAINDYISAPMTATTFSNLNNKPSREVITSELIYYYMTALNIPFSCEHWHFSRLLTLIKVCNIKNSPGKKIPPREVMSRNRALNAKRRAKLGSNG